MVGIDPPPPARATDPVLHLLPQAASLQRIYRPDQYGTTACGFRTGGPFSLSGCVVEVFGDTGVVEPRGGPERHR